MTTHRFFVRLLVFCLLVTALPLQAQGAPHAPQATITVNSLGDEADADTGDGICDTEGKRQPPTSYSSVCTLRAAIATANSPR
jgi:CSLREA domain-containing protein